MFNKKTGMYESESILAKKERMTIEAIKEINRRIDELFGKKEDDLQQDEHNTEES